MSRFIKIGEAAKILGVSIQTLRRWEDQGYLVPDRKSKGNTRFYDLDQLMGKTSNKEELTIAYARVGLLPDGYESAHVKVHVPR